MSPTPTCEAPVADPTTQLVDINRTFAQYMCRAGFRVESGGLHRTCDANGTWSGSPPVCVVDSVMPKAYLVILIVGATVAVFLACIPYDFYRFRKRKKKVRDHQERLSLVTRIAPGHAKVIIETVALEPEQTANTHQRKFGLKSLFSVFRFVGGKMKSGHGAQDSSHPLCPESHVETLSGSDVGPESDGLTASSFVFPSDPASTTGHSSHDMGLESCDEESELNDKSAAPLTPTASAHGESGSSKGTRYGAISPSPSTGAVSKKSFLVFQRANDMFSRKLTAIRQEADAREASSPSPGPSEPAVVQVTCLNDESQENETGTFPNCSAGYGAVKDIPPSTSSPEMTSLAASTSKSLERRTLPPKATSITYHSMPSIKDNAS